MREQHLVLSHFTTQETFNTESDSVDEAWKKKRKCVVLDWIALIYTWALCFVCYYDVITAEQFTRYQTLFVVLGS